MRPCLFFFEKLYLLASNPIINLILYQFFLNSFLILNWVCAVCPSILPLSRNALYSSINKSASFSPSTVFLDSKPSCVDIKDSSAKKKDKKPIIISSTDINSYSSNFHLHKMERNLSKVKFSFSSDVIMERDHSHLQPHKLHKVVSLH